MKYVDLGSSDVSLGNTVLDIPYYIYSSLRNTTFSGLMLSARVASEFEKRDSLVDLGVSGLSKCLVFNYEGYEFYTYDLKKLYIKVAHDLTYFVNVYNVYDFKTFILKYLIFRGISYIELYDNLLHSVLPSPDVLLSSNYRDVYLLKGQEWFRILSSMGSSYFCTLSNGADITIHKDNYYSIDGSIFVDIDDAIEYLIIKSI